MRGDISLGLNSSLSFLHSTGPDVGGFAGPLPTPELLVRWVQSSVYRSRFCPCRPHSASPVFPAPDAPLPRLVGIHSFKPTPESPTGGAEVTTPWLYPEVLPIVRGAIERRYEILPYLYALMHEAAGDGEAPMTWPGWGPFERDPNVFEEEVLDGQDYWAGTGRVFVAGCYFKGLQERTVRRRSSLPSSPRTERLTGPFDRNALAGLPPLVRGLRRARRGLPRPQHRPLPRGGDDGRHADAPRARRDVRARRHRRECDCPLLHVRPRMS